MCLFLLGVYLGVRLWGHVVALGLTVGVAAGLVSRGAAASHAPPAAREGSGLPHPRPHVVVALSITVVLVGAQHSLYLYFPDG